MIFPALYIHNYSATALAMTVLYDAPLVSGRETLCSVTNTTNDLNVGLRVTIADSRLPIHLPTMSFTAYWLSMWEDMRLSFVRYVLRHGRSGWQRFLIVLYYRQQ